MMSKYYNAETFEYWGSRNPFLKLMAAVKQSSQTAEQKGQKYGRDVPHKIDIDEHYLEWLFNEQMGCCPYYEKLGIIKPLNLNLLYETYNFLTPSVDRIDSNFGYIKGNVVITFRGTNNSKLNIPYDRFMEQLAEFEGINIKVIKKSKNIINKLFNPNISNNMKPIDLMRAFVDAGDLTYAMKVLKLSDEIPSKSQSTKTKSKSNGKVKNGRLDTTDLDSSTGEKRKARRKFLKPKYKPFDESKNLVDVTEQYNWSSPDNIFARDDKFINGVSGSLYLSPNGTMSGGLYVDVDSLDEEFLVALN
jgi:hypothetical protein